MKKDSVSEQSMLIAEMCQNHNGSPEILEEMVRLAADAGATHAKIQGIYSAELVYRERFEVGGSGRPRPFEAEFKRLESLELTEATEKSFVEWCLLYDVTPMITVFTHAGIDRAVRQGFTSFKIASYDCTSLALIERCLPHAQELVVSTGGTRWDDISKAAELLSSWVSSVDARLLHAVTVYPTSLRDFNPARMLALQLFGLPFGYSDHTAPKESGLVASLAAAYLGASAIERHFSILDPSETRDGPVSVSPAQLREIREAMGLGKPVAHEAFRELAGKNPDILAAPSFSSSEVETDNVDYYKGRFASWQDGNQVMSWEPWRDGGQ